MMTAIRYVDTGMVIGLGVSEELAWEDAREQVELGCGSVGHEESISLEDTCEVVVFDSKTHEVAMKHGIVQIVPR